MNLTARGWSSITTAINSLFYIKSKSNDDQLLQEQCQKTIDMLILKYPGLVPMHSKLLAEQDSRVVDETSIARFC
jgi:hypothetical protein